jgi:hypothetical protein
VDRFGWPVAVAGGAGFACIAAMIWLVTAADQPMAEPAPTAVREVLV